MNQTTTSVTTADFRYLDLYHPVTRAQIERGLADLGTREEVIWWFFAQVDALKAEYEREAVNFDHYVQ